MKIREVIYCGHLFLIDPSHRENLPLTQDAARATIHMLITNQLELTMVKHSNPDNKTTAEKELMSQS